MKEFSNKHIQLINDIESIFNNTIVEDKIYEVYFEPGTRFVKFYYEFSVQYNNSLNAIYYRKLNDPHYWNEEYQDKINKEIITSDFKQNKTQIEVERQILPRDIDLKLRNIGLEATEIRILNKLCKLIYTKNINVGYDQLIRSALIVSEFDKFKLVEIIKGKFMKDPRDVLVYAHEKSKGMNYGIELFK